MYKLDHWRAELSFSVLDATQVKGIGICELEIKPRSPRLTSLDGALE